jgi:ABC-2 type transport system ATP-binding protein
VRRRVVAVVAVGVALLAGAVVALSAVGGQPGHREELLLIGGTREADGAPVNLSATLYLPDGLGEHDNRLAPAVLLAHGYGGTKESVAEDAAYFADRGFVALTYTARGFGTSGGLVHLDSPDYEVKDAQRMLDYLAARPEVARNGRGDPIVGVVGGSYGGALALLLAGTDPRVDAVVPSDTWNDLRQALFPQYAVDVAGVQEQRTPADVRPEPTPGVFKRSWTALLLGATAANAAGPPGPPAPGPAASATPGQEREQLGLQTLRTACGRIAADLCLGYVNAATTGRPDRALLDLLAASSPARVADRITAPTLLIQGQTDSLFDLTQADATANAIAARGTEVHVVWRAGGHDGGPGEINRRRRLTLGFLERRLAGAGSRDDAPFGVTVPDATVSSADSNPAPQLRDAPAYPGLPQPGEVATALDERRYPLAGDEQLAIAPPGATPAAVSVVPGVSGAVADLAGSVGAQAPGPTASTGSPLAALGTGVLPGQAATFQTAPLAEPLTVVGSPRVRLRVSSTASDATLFASVQDVAPDGSTTLPRRLVAPVRLEDLPPGGREVTLALPAIVHDVPVGHRLRVVVSTTDQAYAMPDDARGYRISLAGDGALTVPTARLTTVGTGGAVVPLLALGGVLALAALLAAAAAVRGAAVRGRDALAPGLLDVPVALTGLGKAYGNGFRAVSDVSLRVTRGQVLGLLGPNGAGKTTTLRMLMGLIHPSEGDIRVFGHRVRPGAAVLSRVGAFVEGPGFLPHLTGIANLRLYWQATGRPAADAHLDEVLEVAGLGDDVERTVRTYSHGMMQRLAIAQAMLGLPELLVLDEPTNGLDPPQIREMREVLQRYAATGRTVVVSSHLLAEVEETCTDVAVMHQGRLIAQGPVAQLVEAATIVVVDVDDPIRAEQVAAGVPSVGDVVRTPTGLVLRADAAARAKLVRALAGAGLGVERVAPQRGLEQTFLALVGESPAEPAPSSERPLVGER